MNVNLDLRRQSDIFDAYAFGKTPVTIIGAGATGSWLALCLAKMGISNITVWDYDKVEEHNVPNQAYGIFDVAKESLKVDALYDLINNDTGLAIKVKPEAFTDQRLSGYVFLMVDSMKARKEIWEASVKMKSAVKLLVEPRMGLNEARIYNVLPTNLEHIKRYENCWYSDEDAEVSACGTSQTVITTAMTVASMCARQLINHFNGVDMDNELLMDVMYNAIYPTKW